MSNVIKRCPTIPEIKTRILEISHKSKQAWTWEKIPNVNAVLDILATIFEDVVENEQNLWVSLSNFFNACAKMKKWQ